MSLLGVNLLTINADNTELINIKLALIKSALESLQLMTDEEYIESRYYDKIIAIGGPPFLEIMETARDGRPWEESTRDEMIAILKSLYIYGGSFRYFIS